MDVIRTVDQSFEVRFAKLLKGVVSFFMPVWPSVSPHGTTGMPQDGFS
jgi:hypothetical protein